MRVDGNWVSVHSGLLILVLFGEAHQVDASRRTEKQVV